MNTNRQEFLKLVAVGALCVLMGCSYGHMLTRDEVPQMAADQGFIAFAADVNRRTTVTLCRDADMSHCLDFDELGPDGPAVTVSQVPAGCYCLITIAADDLSGGMGLVKHFEADTTSCFDVAAGAIAYPGHLVYLVKETATMMAYADSGWDMRDSMEAEVRSAYPKLASWPVVSVRTRALH